MNRPNVPRPSLSLLLIAGLATLLPSARAANAETWEPGPNMSLARGSVQLVFLPSGNVLAAGGVPNGATIYTNRVDVFDVTLRTFFEIAAMPTSHRRQDHALLLPDGRVLVAGEQIDGVNKFSHVYSEATGLWSQTTNHPAINRFDAVMVLLPDGKVVYIGGYVGGFGPTYDSVELFDPVTSTWSSTGSMAKERLAHTATLLTTGPNAGKVLVVGGGLRNETTVEATCELYDPATGTFSPTGSMNVARAFHSATRLMDGRVLVAGGVVAGWIANNQQSAEIYDPLTGTWSNAASMTTRRAIHTETLLPNGDVLVVGGTQAGSTSPTASAEIYHPLTNTWHTMPMMSTPRLNHSALPLPSGEVLIVGGHNGTQFLATSEFFSFILPIAIAGEDQPVRAGTNAQLDGSASYDLETAAADLEFAWSLLSRPIGSSAHLLDPTSPMPALATDLPGNYTVKLIVTDEQGHTGEDQVTIVGNSAPLSVLRASADLAEVGNLIIFDAGSSSDPEDDPLDWLWALSSRPAGSSANLGSFRDAAGLAVDVPGTYEIDLTAVDFLGAGTTARRALTVLPLGSGLIFADGFENGDLSLWSEVEP